MRQFLLGDHSVRIKSTLSVVGQSTLRVSVVHPHLVIGDMLTEPICPDILHQDTLAAARPMTVV